MRPSRMARGSQRLGQALGLALLVMGFSTPAALAVPAFAVQTGRPCAACHIGGFGPQLTPFGRDFKLRGYTARAVDFDVPLSAMAVASYVHTAQDQPPAPHFSANDNVAVDQISLFLAGGVGAHFGGFVQSTYDGVARAFHGTISTCGPSPAPASRARTSSWD